MASWQSAPVVFPDTAGEDAAAPDITSVAVSTDSSRAVSFVVSFANRTFVGSDMAVDVYLNSDRRRATGDKKHWGADYLVQMGPAGTHLSRWSGSSWTQLAKPVLNAGHGVKTVVPLAAFGDPAVFSFAVAAASGVVWDASGGTNMGAVHADWLPNTTATILTYEVPVAPKAVLRYKPGQRSTKARPCRPA